MKKRRAVRRPADDAVAGKAPASVAVNEEERRRLIECSAFFRAERFRNCEPGRFRRQDIQAAAADIDAVIRTACKRTGK